MRVSYKRYGAVKTLLATTVLSLIFSVGVCQTMFTAFQSSQRKADQAYSDKNFREAVSRYEAIFSKHPAEEVNLRVARSYYFMREYASAVTWYEKFVNKYGGLQSTDQYYLAESYSSLGSYEQAVQQYNAILARSSDDILIAKKIWRLKNIQYLYEDSLHYVVQEINVNTPASEFGASFANDQLIFLSNLESIAMIESRDESTQTSFYQLYTAPFLKDTLGVNTGRYGKPVLFQKDIGSKFNDGPVAFFNDGKSMVYTRSADEPGSNGRRTLQLYFAEWKGDAWITRYSFPYNSSSHSITDPAISEDGKVLYFSSDMKGGQGGKDLYRSQLVNGQWSKPENLIDLNTAYDEVFPFLHQGKTVYFASNGHAGMGGLDIFKSEILGAGFNEVTNAGYPINTHYDDFSLVLDSLGAVGYFASNRNNRQDDIFRVDIDMQAYPLAIEGVIRYKEIGNAVAHVLGNAQLVLIDNVKGTPVYETFSDTSGNFVLHIPYFSQYKIKVIESNKNESIVSLEVPRHRKQEDKHDIVVVRDVFKTNP